MCSRLSSLDGVTESVQIPRYVPDQHRVGIVHIGMGAFHRAHQAVMTDDALAHQGGDWRIVGVSLRSKNIAAELNNQNGLYTLLERGEGSTQARVIAAIDHVIAADAKATIAMLCDPRVRVVTLTVTEAGYGIDRETRQPDMNNPVVSADIANPAASVGVLGLLVESIKRRRESAVEPYTVLSCDNLPANGEFLCDGVTAFSRSAYGDELADWIDNNVAFPCSMVDRITPASTNATYDEARRHTGCDDRAAIETEPFTQWIIEDNFPSGRPQWEAGGAVFVADVSPYERMKLMMLNGSHSMLAYSGHLTGMIFVRDVMQNEYLAALVQRHLKCTASLLESLPGVDYSDYAFALTKRFSNPSIAHQTFQIASDGTEKLPQRIFQPAVEALNADKDTRPFAFSTAMWMRFCLRQLDDDTSYELRDPRALEIARVVEPAGRDSTLVSEAIHSLPDFVPQQLSQDNHWRQVIDEVLGVAFKDGCLAVVKREAEIYC